MKRTTLRFALVLLVVSSSNPIILGGEQSIQPEEYAVYAVITQTEFIRDDTNQVIIVKRILDKRGDNHESIINQISWKFSELEPSTIDDYVHKSRKAAHLDSLFQLPVKYFLIDAKEAESFFKKGRGWGPFYKKYPKSPGLLAFSRVGLNQEGNQALVYVNLSCGSLCGEGTWILLEKKAGGWAVRNQYTSVRY